MRIAIALLFGLAVTALGALLTALLALYILLVQVFGVRVELHHVVGERDGKHQCL